MAALEWLKDSNLLYEDVTVNFNWINMAASENNDLWQAISS